MEGRGFMSNILKRQGKYALSLAKKNVPWTNVYGLARTTLALGTLLTLLSNPPANLFRPGSGIDEFPLCQGVGKYGIFCLTDPYLELARWLSIIILIVAASGWRPRYTAVFHWWVALSLQTSAITLDGGDQISTVLTLLLLPIALTDNRKWHWQKATRDNDNFTTSYILKSLIAISALIAIRFQVSIVYFHAATAKLSVDEWVDGTILYYWLNDQTIGLPNWLKIFFPILTTRLVVIFTWGTLLLETLLFMGLVMPKRYWKPLLIAGIVFHAGIALTMGLISFGLAMTCALILYLRPFEAEFDFSKLIEYVKKFLEKIHVPLFRSEFLHKLKYKR